MVWNNSPYFYATMINQGILSVSIYLLIQIYIEFIISSSVLVINFILDETFNYHIEEYQSNKLHAWYIIHTIALNSNNKELTNKEKDN